MCTYTNPKNNSQLRGVINQLGANMENVADIADMSVNWWGRFENYGRERNCCFVQGLWEHDLHFIKVFCTQNNNIIKNRQHLIIKRRFFNQFWQMEAVKLSRSTHFSQQFFWGKFFCVKHFTFSMSSLHCTICCCTLLWSK